MAWLEDLEFRDRWFSSSVTEISAGTIEGCLNSSRRFITKRITAAAVALVTAAIDESLDTVGDVREAQQLLAYRQLLQNQTRRFRDGGKVISESDANGGSSNTYESTAATEETRDGLLRDALELLEPYLTIAEATLIADTMPRTKSVPINFVW